MAPVTGTEDRVFNQLARLIKAYPALPLVAGGALRLQPVWVRDVAQAVFNSMQEEGAAGKTYALAGPEVLTLSQLADLTYHTIREPHNVLPVPESEWGDTFVDGQGEGAPGLLCLAWWCPGAADPAGRRRPAIVHSGTGQRAADRAANLERGWPAEQNVWSTGPGSLPAFQSPLTTPPLLVQPPSTHTHSPP